MSHVVTIGAKSLSYLTVMTRNLMESAFNFNYWLNGSARLLSKRMLAPQIAGGRSTTLLATAFVGSVITYAANADQIIEETPFLWAGKVYADQNSNISDTIRNRYGNTPFKYLSASQCIRENPSSTDSIQTSSLIWDRLQSIEEVEVCLFRVLNKLRTPERITVWMLNQRWEKGEVVDVSSIAHLLNSPGPITQLGFYWDVNERGSAYGSGLKRVQLGLLTTSSKVTVETDEYRGVLSVTLDDRPIFGE